MQLSRLKNSSCLQAYCEQNINIQIFTLTPLNSPGCKLYNGILVCYNIFKIQVQVSRFPRVGRLQEKARSPPSHSSRSAWRVDRLADREVDREMEKDRL